MLSGAFVNFKTTQDEWRGETYTKTVDEVETTFNDYSRELFNTFSIWNEKWQSQASVDNLVSMVVSGTPIYNKQVF